MFLELIIFVFFLEIFAVNGNGEIKVAKSIPRDSISFRFEVTVADLIMMETGNFTQRITLDVSIAVNSMYRLPETNLVLKYLVLNFIYTMYLERIIHAHLVICLNTKSAQTYDVRFVTLAFISTDRHVEL